MSIDFLDSGIDNKSFLKPDRSGINPFLLENNTKQINEIIQFFQGENKLLLVNGFLGTGKTRIVDHAAKFLNTQTVTLKYNCFVNSLWNTPKRVRFLFAAAEKTRKYKGE